MSDAANPYSEQEIEAIRREVAGALRGTLTLLTERWLDTVDALRAEIVVRQEIKEKDWEHIRALGECVVKAEAERDSAIAERNEMAGPFCEDTGERAKQGACPTHHGDACLVMPEGAAKRITDLKMKSAGFYETGMLDAESKAMHDAIIDLAPYQSFWRNAISDAKKKLTEYDARPREALTNPVRIPHDEAMKKLGLACPCGIDPDDCKFHAPGGLEDMAEHPEDYRDPKGGKS